MIYNSFTPFFSFSFQTNGKWRKTGRSGNKNLGIKSMAQHKINVLCARQFRHIDTLRKTKWEINWIESWWFH